jgi:enterochelin esterase-like enzyme
MKSEARQMINQNFSEGLIASLENWFGLSEENREDILQNIYSSLELQNYPFYESDSIVTLIYKCNCQNVALLSDITGWTDSIPFKNLNGTDLFFLKLELEPDARIQYLLLVNGDAVCDPSNKNKCLHGLGEMSELAMPKYERHPYLEEYLYGKEGSYAGLIKHSLPPGALPYHHEVHIYLPPDYNSNAKYPTVYFHDGPDYIRFGLAAYSINRLIVEKQIDSCIAVFVTPPNLHQPKEPNRSTEYGMNDDYVKFWCDELVNFIDNNYSTLRLPQERLVVGDSYAGLISLYIALSRTDVFANVYSQSGYFSFNNDRIIKLIDEHLKKSIKLYLDIGTYEEKVGADFLPSTELDFTSANRRMKRVLSNKDYGFIYREYHEGHTWGNWRRHLIDALKYFLERKEN